MLYIFIMKFNRKILIQERQKNNFSADDLAFEIRKRKLKITGQTIARWEKGLSYPDAKYLAMLCLIFKVFPSHFFITNNKGGILEKNP